MPNGRPSDHTPGPFNAALDAAIAREAARVPAPAPPLCGVDGCPLPAGHVERAGSPHAPAIVEQRTGRPPLPRYRADLRIVVELAAEDLEHAEARLDALLDLITPRVKATVRGARVGTSTAILIDRITDPSEA